MSAELQTRLWIFPDLPRTTILYQEMLRMIPTTRVKVKHLILVETGTQTTWYLYLIPHTVVPTGYWVLRCQMAV